MKKKSKPKSMTTITRVKLLEAQTALTDLRTYEHADQLKRIGGQFDKLAKIMAADFQTHTRRIVEINERLPDKAQVADFVNLQKRITNLGEQANLRLDEHSAAINKLGAFADDVNKQLGEIKPREQLDPRFTETVRENLLRAPRQIETLEKDINRLSGALINFSYWLKEDKNSVALLSERLAALEPDSRFTETVRENLLRAPLRMDTLEKRIDRLMGPSISQYDLLKSLEDRANSLSKRESELFSALQSIGERLKALEHLSGIRCNVPAEPTPGWQKTCTFITYGITPKPSLWQKFKRFLGF